MQVLDLKGQSGAAYRFRLVPTPEDLPAHAGNFVLAHGSTSNAAKVPACGTRGSLVELATLWPTLARNGGRVYVRLNVSRKVRLAEHDDLVAALKPTDVLAERD